MPKKLTQEEVLRRFRERWGDAYAHEKVVYINKRTPVIVTCPIHGDFEILPLEHANGCGCQKCGHESQARKVSKPKYDKNELLRRLHEIHCEDMFDLSVLEEDSFVYNGVNTIIPVTCKVCGTVSNKTASSLLSGSLCNTCRLKKFSKLQQGKAKPVGERKLIAGIGVNDVEGTSKHDKIYHIWREMITRCFNKNYWKKRPNYENYTVCEEWKRFSNYISWYNTNYNDGFDVDKDLLSFYTGTKIYSPDTCCFLPPEINNALSSTKTIKRNLPVGVHYVSGCITASCGSVHLGTFKNVEEAHTAYLKAKKKRIIELANKWKDKLEPRVYDALINLDVDKFFNTNK